MITASKLKVNPIYFSDGSNTKPSSTECMFTHYTTKMLHLAAFLRASFSLLPFSCAKEKED